ncbi:hypothetical protein FQA39_LY09377 [Lamprigera yunnana]|nr:hypothetical protein FQA39_LY09377 [Lamprigera yunnana]
MQTRDDEYSQANDDQKKKYKKYFGHVENLSPLTGVVFTLFIFSIYGVVYLIDDIFPRALLIVDEENNVDYFIAERAQNDLKDLTVNGPRVTGTYENEVLAVELLRKKIMDIVQNAHSNHKIEFDLQLVSGIVNSSSVYLNTYENLQNVLVKVHSKKHSEHSLLVNSHFDSAPTSPGASDDGINCAVALEVLRKISKSSVTFDHNVIFLFNGGEEIGLLASHGFITQHRWAREIKAFINLDANGSGGKMLLFQTGPREPWLLKYFRKVSLPNAQVIGEELFQSGLLPFGTDYTMFTDVGKIVGLNFAFIKDGQRYHTKFDSIDNIPLSTYQHAGDIVLNLVRNLANASELVEIHKEAKGNSVYFDVMGLFLIHYTQTISVVINLAVSLFSVLIAVKSFYDFGVTTSKEHVKYIALSCCGIVFGLLATAGFATIIAVILNALHYNMTWYRHNWIAIGLYAAPSFTIPSIFLALFKRIIITDLTFNMHTQLQSHLSRLIWTLLLLLGTCMGIRSLYVVLIPIFFQTAAFVLIHMTCSQYTKRTWQIVYFIFTIPPTMCSLHFLLLLSPTITSAFGHIQVNGEVYVAFMYLFFFILIFSTYTPFITLLKKPFIVMLLWSTIFLISLVIVFTPVAFPYSGNPESAAPQRFSVLYQNSIIRKDIDNNIYGRLKNLSITLHDINSEETIKKYINEPVFTKETDMIPIRMAARVELNSKKNISKTETHYNFTIDSPTILQLNIEAADKVTISHGKIFFSNKEVILKSSAPYYKIVYHRGKESIPFILFMKIKHTPNQDLPLLKFNLMAHYHYNTTNISIPYVDKILEQFPVWTNVDSNLQVYDALIF